MKTFLIAGSIVDTDADKETFEDVTPVQVNSFLKSLKADEEVTFEITSWGGSVAAGLAICNLLKKASAEGHKTTSHVIGVAASCASLIACACDKLTIDANAFLMIHNPWSVTMGNAEAYRKEADTLDKFRDAMLSVYRTKFDASDEIIKSMLDSETWIVGEQVELFKVKAEVISTDEPLKAVALGKGTTPKFAKMPQIIKDMLNAKLSDASREDSNLTTNTIIDMENKETNKAVDVEKEIQDAIDAVEAANQTPEVKEEQPAEEMVAKAEVDKRVSGMQSAMAKQMDAMKKDYEAKISEFQVQIKAKDEELTKAKADATSLKDSLDKANGELSKMTSALEEKTNALAALNASVNTPNEQTNWKALKGQEFFDWYKKTH